MAGVDGQGVPSRIIFAPFGIYSHIVAGYLDDSGSKG